MRRETLCTTSKWRSAVIPMNELSKLGVNASNYHIRSIHTYDLTELRNVRGVKTKDRKINEVPGILLKTPLLCKVLVCVVL